MSEALGRLAGQRVRRLPALELVAGQRHEGFAEGDAELLQNGQEHVEVHRPERLVGGEPIERAATDVDAALSKAPLQLGDADAAPAEGRTDGGNDDGGACHLLPRRSKFSTEDAKSGSPAEYAGAR